MALNEPKKKAKKLKPTRGASSTAQCLPKLDQNTRPQLNPSDFDPLFNKLSIQTSLATKISSATESWFCLCWRDRVVVFAFRQFFVFAHRVHWNLGGTLQS
jgi:hypothetical protein